MAAYRFGRCDLDVEAREFRVDGEVVHLEPQVFDVLAHLVANRHRMVSKSELLDTIWGSQFVSESALASRIKTARSAIGDDGASQLLIRTHRGSGYRFVGEVHIVDGAATVATQQPWPSLGALPSSRLTLVGRGIDLDSLGPLLRTHRVVTVSGPGGVGKSTVAIELAHRIRDDDRLDAAFVELAPVRHGDEVARAVADATGIEGAGTADVGALAASLSARELLLVLDNCEHLLDATAELVHALLDSAPSVRILTTSREPLRIDGEVVYVLGSLGRDAVTLFVERAAAATGRPGFTTSDPDIVELCERLDGLPLAIELAAAQMRHLTPGELLHRLDHRLALLVGGRPRAGDRHVTLATTIDWSYHLLSGPSRDVFQRLGVFPATFDLAAVQAVATELDPVTATLMIGDLVAKNLVVHDHDSGRYRLLETIRLFASQRLAESGLTAEVTERLRRHVVDRTTALSRPQAWLSASLAARNRDDIENLRVAFDAGVAAGRFDDAVDIMIGLSSLWRNALSYSEGLRWLRILRSHDLAPREKLWLNIVAADLGLGSGDPRLMAGAAAAAADLCEKVDDPAGAVIASIYGSLTMVSTPEQAVAGLEAARDRAEEIGEPQLNRLARAFRVMALLAAGRRTGLSDEIRALTDSASDGYDWYIAIWTAWMDAVIDRDAARLRHWMDVQNDNISTSGLRENWLTLFSQTLTAIGEGSDYLPHLLQARRRAELEGRNADVDCVLALAYAAACQGDPVRAAELIGASSGALFHDTANFVQHMIIRDAVVRPLLDRNRFDEALMRGRDMNFALLLAENGL